MKKLYRRIFFSVFSGLFFGNLFYFGTKFLNATFENHAVEYSGLDFIFILPIIFALSLFFFFAFELKIKEKSDKIFNLKRWQIFLPLVLVSLVTFLAFFPGHYPYDSSEMFKNFSSGEISNHYSPLVTIVLGAFLSLGKALGSLELGHAILIILQFLLLDFIFTEIIFFCAKKINRKIFGILFTIFFTLNPLVQTLLIRSGQDTIFGGIFALLALELLKISEDEKYFSEKGKRKFVYLFALIFFLCATRNNGIYALLPVLLVAIFALKKDFRKKFLLAFSIPTLVFLGYNFIINNTLVKTKDSFFKETLNVPIMQIARAMHYHPDENFAEELKTYFKEDCDTWINQKWNFSRYNYSAGISDPYKNCLIAEKVDEDPLKFLNLYRRIGEKNIASYIEAPIVLDLGLFHPYTKYDQKKRTYTWHRFIDSFYDSYELYGMKTTNLLPLVHELYDFLIRDEGWSKIPILHLLWGAPIVTLLCLLSILFAFYKKKYKYLLPLALIFGLILTVALSPVILFRYIFPAVLTLPILAYIFIKNFARK